jgi:hypothetical protein
MTLGRGGRPDLQVLQAKDILSYWKENTLV